MVDVSGKGMVILVAGPSLETLDIAEAHGFEA